MKSFKLFPILALGAVSFFAGCGDDGSSSAPEEAGLASGENAADLPNTPSFSVYSCEEASDAESQAKLESAKSNISDILLDIGDGDFKSARTISAQTKKDFKAVLDKYPGNCEAQLGYALSIVTDLVNNPEIKAFTDTVINKVDLADMGVDDFNRLLVTTDGRLLTTMAQSAMANAIPSIDSAMIYMKNIVGDPNFTCHYTYEDRTFELDRGEFAPTLAALYVIKSVLVFGASLNIDFSANKSYAWMNAMDHRRSVPSESAKQIIALMSKESSFSTVYSQWATSYKDIPNLLDSAIAFVEVGLQYGIEESKTGLQTQKDDLYIVGDDEMSDVSVSDFEKAIDSLEHYRNALRTGVEVTLPHGSKVTINVAKFFEITDGWQDYLPYHKFNDASTWNNPDASAIWDEDPEDSFAENELHDLVYDQLTKKYSIDSYYLSLYQAYWQDDNSLIVYIDVETNDGEFFYKEYNVKMEGCKLTFTAETYDYDEEDYFESYLYDSNPNITFVPSPITLRSEVCKVENGVTLFATIGWSDTPNAFYFTDASGKKTISLQALDAGKFNKITGRFEDYTLDEMQQFIFFPDITFNGVLPGMTADKFWNILKTEGRDAD
jgi:hypothetical protein